MIQELSLPGLKLITLKIYHDERGFFMERYRESLFQEMGISEKFVQDNHSRSLPRVLRGLHYQHSPNQGKLVGVLRGKIFDVVVDLRSQSPTYGKWESVELSDEAGNFLWVPAGFAHGFCVLGDEDADVVYKVDAPYSPKTEGGLHYADPHLAITWPISNPIVSSKDQILPSFESYRQKPIF